MLVGIAAERLARVIVSNIASQPSLEPVTSLNIRWFAVSRPESCKAWASHGILRVANRPPSRLLYGDSCRSHPSILHVV